MRHECCKVFKINFINIYWTAQFTDFLWLAIEIHVHVQGSALRFKEIYNHIIIFNADACSSRNPSISSSMEACLNQINWTCDNEWHYLITILINVTIQSTNWTVRKRYWHRKLHPLAETKCNVSLLDRARVNRKEKKGGGVFLFKTSLKIGLTIFPDVLWT